MILNSTPENEAILSNVAETGEFRIRNSAKAFSILSSGLYANKIRAIIRELSCNAYDSHVAAGKPDLPFDVHLPSAYEPHFSIRDYGTGLDHDQVTNIYTTYFESTKTGSNDFVGALGLGSKSPFSYTDNFTVTAIKDGVRRIYSAFINNEGVPSIALMLTEESSDPNGVEVKFAVENRQDNSKFQSEANYVYKFFKVKPVISGATTTITDIEYIERDVIPGIHIRKQTYEMSGAYAVMGHIAYPINIPDGMVDQHIDAILRMNSLTIEFEIGELDFQASREGLSYIPQTVDAIRRKIDTLNLHLATKIEDEVKDIESVWEKAKYLESKRRIRLYHQAVIDYLAKTPLGARINNEMSLIVRTGLLEKKFNINLKGFSHENGKVETLHEYSHWVKGEYQSARKFYLPEKYTFVVQDTNVGSYERARYHWKNTKEANGRVYVLSPMDRTKPMKTELFFKLIHNPPDVRKASDLITKSRKLNSAASVPIMVMQDTSYGRRSDSTSWGDAGKLDSFDDTKTYYYMPLNNYAPVSDKIPCAHSFYSRLRASNIDALKNVSIYGVRVSGMKHVENLKNWVNIEDYVTEVLSNIDDEYIDNVAIKTLAVGRRNPNDYEISSMITNKNSDYINFLGLVAKAHSVIMDTYEIKGLLETYQPEKANKIKEMVDKFDKIHDNVNAKYPMMQFVDRRYTEARVIADYINLVDASA